MVLLDHNMKAGPFHALHVFPIPAIQMRSVKMILIHILASARKGLLVMAIHVQV